MTSEQIAAIKERWENTTGGQWEAVMWIDGKGGAVWGEYFPVVEAKWFKTAANRTLEETRQDLEFCAHAHQDIPALFAEVERLQAEITRLTAAQEQP